MTGRAPARCCRLCGNSKHVPADMRPRVTTCRACEQLAANARTKVVRARLREQKRLTEHHSGSSVFDRTIVQLEQEWGVPYARWTRVQHLAHTKCMVDCFAAATARPAGSGRTPA